MKKNSYLIVSSFILTLVLGMMFTGTVFAQTPEASGGNGGSSARKAPPVPVASTKAKPQPRLRNIQPHVFRAIDPALDSVWLSRVLDVTSNGTGTDGDWSKLQLYPHEVWYLELEIKPMRSIVVDLPGRDGKLVRQNVWYLIYRVRNPGECFVLEPQKMEPGTKELRDALAEVPGFIRGKDRKYYKITTVKDRAITFIPRFELATNDEVVYNPQTKQRKIVQRRYVDRFMPLATLAIINREDPGRRILDTTQMSFQPIPAGIEESAEGRDKEKVWGVAAWCGVNPSVDTFSVYVYGLTNDRQWVPDENNPNKGVFKQKVLKLNYWHPGEGNVFRLTQEGGLDYEWIFE